MPYQSQGLELPENPDGLEYRNMGAMENHVWSVIAKQMKHNHTSWSKRGGNHLAKILAKKCSGIMIDDEYEDSVVGTPQGGNLSPLLANIMLNELDKEKEKRGLNFVRYADDCIIMVGSEVQEKNERIHLPKLGCKPQLQD